MDYVIVYASVGDAIEMSSSRSMSHLQIMHSKCQDRMPEERKSICDLQERDKFRIRGRQMPAGLGEIRTGLESPCRLDGSLPLCLPHANDL